MSGIEVAGLVLGAVPILIEALSAYRKGLAKTRILMSNKDGLVEQLAETLLLHRQTIFETVKTILRNSGCESLTTLDAARLDCLLQDVATKTRILNYLGSGNNDVLLAVLRRSDEVIRRIAGHLAGTLPSTKEPTDDLTRLIQAHQATQNKISFLHKVKLLFSVSELKETTRDLDNLVNRMIQFVNAVLINRQPEGRSSSSQTAKLSKLFRNIRRLVNELHLAINKTWRTNCHARHTIGMSLEDRIDHVSLVSGHETDSIFQLALMSEVAPKRSIWHKIPCQVAHELIDPDQYPLTMTTSSRVNILPPTLATSTPSANLVPLQDMCGFLSTMKSGRNSYSLVLFEGPSLARTVSVDQNCHSVDKAEMISLKKILHERVVDLPLQKRMILAMEISSNFLQLSRTQWCHHGSWSSDTICFLQQPQGVSSPVDLSHAFVLSEYKPVLPTDGNNTSTPYQINDKAALLELGILLLELWHNKTFESHFGLVADDFYERWKLALKWLDEDTNLPLELYDKAVSHCIRGMFGDESRFEHRFERAESKFWDVFCRDVILQLYLNCKQWR